MRRASVILVSALAVGGSAGEPTSATPRSPADAAGMPELAPEPEGTLQAQLPGTPVALGRLGARGECGQRRSSLENDIGCDSN